MWPDARSWQFPPPAEGSGNVPLFNPRRRLKAQRSTEQSCEAMSRPPGCAATAKQAPASGSISYADPQDGMQTA